MKKLLILPLFLFLFFSVYSEEESLYKDLSREHWAYNAIENLVYKGIIDVEDDFFNGEQNISKYEFVYMLSKVLNKLDSEKASKDDFLIVENLVYEFSKDLTSFGFDSHEYINKIKEIERSYEQMETENLKYENALKLLSDRIKDLENNSLQKNVDISSEKALPMNIFSKLEINLKESVHVENLDNKDYQQEYELNIGYKGKSFETFIKRNSIKDEFDLKMSLSKIFKNEYKLNFNTIGYEKREQSYYSKLNYDNYWISNDNKIEEFNSYGLNLQNDKLKLMLDSEEEEVNLLASFNEKYYNLFYISNLNKKNEAGNNDTLSNYEAVLKYPLGNFYFSAGYTVLNDLKFSEADFIYRNENSIEDSIKYINTECKFENKNGSLSIAYENKSENDELYNNISSDASYSISENFDVKYRIEFLDVNGMDFYYNNYILLKNSSKNFDTYIYGKFVNFMKEEFTKNTMNSYLDENDKFSLKSFEEENTYKELIIKIRYGLFEKLDLKIGTSLKDKESKSDLELLNYFELSYDYDKNTRLYFYYLQSDMKFDDRKKDLSGELINMDYNKETGIINDFADGKFEFGVELKF